MLMNIINGIIGFIFGAISGVVLTCIIQVNKNKEEEK